MTEPSWRQLSAIPESALKAAILRALDVDPPPEGIADTFHDRGLYVRHCDDGGIPCWIVSNPGDDRSLGSTLHLDGSDALRAARCPAGTPMGDALRRWMRSMGWRPASERPIAMSERPIVLSDQNYDALMARLDEPARYNNGAAKALSHDPTENTRTIT